MTSQPPIEVNRSLQLLPAVNGELDLRRVLGILRRRLWPILGLGLVLFFSGRRRIDSIKSLFMRLLEGLMSLTNATKMFGDVLSYLRLFALGLASSSLAVTFNQLAVDVRDGLPGIGMLLGILVLLLGHLINLALGIVSGFVHGLRLNFIEFFSWGVPEEGYPFRAFAKKEIEHE